MKKLSLLISLATLVIFSSCRSTKTMTDTPVIEKVDATNLLNEMTLKKYMNTITSDDLKEHLYVFASDAFEGRETGTRGQKMAAEYLADFYHAHGLKGPVTKQANPYLQKIPFLDEKTSYGTIRTGDIQLNEGTDFLTQTISKKETADEIIFVGHGMELPEYNDYKDIDVRGKAICVIWGDPMDENRKPYFDTPQDSFLNRKSLTEKGITDLFITLPNQQRYDAQIQFIAGDGSKFKPVFKMDERDEINRPYNLYYLSPSKAAELFGVSPDQYFATVKNKLDKNQPLGGEYSVKDVTIEVERPRKMINAENVVAYIPGRDLKDEVLVISSHMDHVGIIDGKIYNGADDDGSGSMGTLEIAQAFAQAAKEGNGPRRTVVFLNVSGEEKGLWGSEYYADVEPLFPLANTVANLNIDMIGRKGDLRTDDKDYVYIIGSDMLSTELHAVHEKISTKYFPEMEMDYHYNGKNHPERIYYRSDHYNFAKNNIPVIFYFNGTHEDYHQHTDTPDKIDYRQYAKRTQLIFATAWELANMDKRPIVDVED